MSALLAYYTFKLIKKSLHNYTTHVCIVSILCITSYRSSFFTTNPTTKMFSVLSAAKALYMRLQQMRQATNLDAGT